MTKPWTSEDYLREFKTYTSKMLEITTKKNNDYGSFSDPFKNFRTFEELGILVRMSDKFARLRTAIQEKREFQVSDETIEDTCLDLANYALLLMCYKRGANPKEEDDVSFPYGANVESKETQNV